MNSKLTIDVASRVDSNKYVTEPKGFCRGKYTQLFHLAGIPDELMWVLISRLFYNK